MRPLIRQKERLAYQHATTSATHVRTPKFANAFVAKSCELRIRGTSLDMSQGRRKTYAIH
jgi:hypothetical protein